jgi:hypothetical protein
MIAPPPRGITDGVEVVRSQAQAAAADPSVTNIRQQLRHEAGLRLPGNLADGFCVSGRRACLDVPHPDGNEVK